MEKQIIDIYFSDFFEVSPDLLEEYGAFNVSLINDLPLFIDPFLLFNSKNPAYQKLHQDIIRYLQFLKGKSIEGTINEALLKSWYIFKEVEQNWLGFSQVGNKGSGLGIDFARALNANLHSIFSDFGQERVTKGSHLEKLCLIADGVGRDNISDFTTNLIKEFLLDYTQIFARQHLRPEFRRTVVVERVRFNYFTENWERDRFDLPYYGKSYVLLTPKDILTKDDIWISKSDMVDQYDQIALAIPDDQLRAQLGSYFLSVLSDKATKKERNEAAAKALRAFPQVVDYYIRYKEDHGDEAETISNEKVLETQTVFIDQVVAFVEQLLANTPFYQQPWDTFEEARERVSFLKQVIENNDGYRLFYLDGKPIKREEDLQILFRLTWRATPSDVNRETNNGRGPVDFKISRGSKDKSLVEFKLASNSKLRANLEKQVEIYEKANDTDKSLKVILYFSQEELEKVNRILRELNLHNHPDIYLIDARSDNKPSASNA
ncbi:hypothetical protein SE17_04820 [Kouleothrix aurantiaca]|uniref:Coiled-coil protein n=1 Tax=Kouleothrix aurantiaca TaxID=186479 RepID=A0A0P9DVZ3_9CHLR|nr:hypothetical protein SE17_04820 [Kouleothrix aurantiaca]